MKKFYAVLCMLGIVLPYGPFLSWVYENGLAMNVLITEIIDSRISTFAWLDLVVSAMVLFGFVFAEGLKLKMRRPWLPVAGTLTVGVSLGLPLFLLLREMHLEKQGL
jgi:hypothetical protein